MRGLPGGGLTAGGGGLGLIGVVLYLVFAVLSGGGAGVDGPLGNLDGSTVSRRHPARCSAGVPHGSGRERREDCRIVGDVNSIQAYWRTPSQGWTQLQPREDGLLHRPDRDRLRRRRAEVGPFYCPVDKHVYLDLGFFDELQQAVRREGRAVRPGVRVAHEYGHHVQDLLGDLRPRSATTGRAGRRSGTSCRPTATPASGRHATENGYLRPETRRHCRRLNAAAAVGDDRIQAETQGQVNPETWTHGSAAQRQHWFDTGYSRGRASGCDTFHAHL